MTIRPATGFDRSLLSGILVPGNKTHHHLDWCTPFDWLGHQPFWVLITNNSCKAALACIEDPVDIAWIKLFSVDSSLLPEDAWSVLFPKILEHFSTRNGIQILSLGIEKWYEAVLRKNNFKVCQNVVVLDWNGIRAKHMPVSAGCELRPMEMSDLNEIVDLDNHAFEPFWKMSYRSLRKAYRLAAYASVVSFQKKIVGYQISTAFSDQGHLARLGVYPDMQRKGIARWLVNNMFEFFQKEGISKITVNTQDDNLTSLSFYSKMGFYQTGESFPVYHYQFQ